MKNKAISVGCKYKWYHQALSIIKRLLHTVSSWVIVVFGFNNRQRNVWLVK